MRSPRAILWLALPLLCAAGPRGESAAAKLVRQLGSDDFEARQKAEEALRKLGPAALPAVRAGLRSGDAEVRKRCQRILPRIERAWWRRRADAYSADRDGKRRHDLPLQATYEKLAGTSPGARKLFADAVRTNGALLQVVADDRSRGLADYKARCQEVYTAAYAPGGAAKLPAGDLVALLLASTALKETDSDWKDRRAGVAHLFGSQAFRTAVGDRETGAAFRRLLLAWVGSRPADDGVSHQCFLYFVQSANFKEGLPVVRRLIRERRANRVNVRAVGVAVLARVGGKDVAADLEKWWDDETVLIPFGDGPKGRLGDQALAASIRLAGKDPKEYGLRQLFLRIKGPGDMLWMAPVHWFASDADRRAALKKWKAEAGKRK
jgi:hypothetical protein